MLFTGTQKAVTLLSSALLLSLTLMQCTKEGLTSVERNLVTTPDSTIFSPFYDTTIIAQADMPAGPNDIIAEKGVLNIIKTKCSTTSCHGGGVSPMLTNYNEVMSLVTAGNPSASKLYELVTTHNPQKAMPPVNTGMDLTLTERNVVYNWILNGAKEAPGLADFRPKAIALMVNGCTSANCHNQATVAGAWARAGLLNINPTDTFTYTYINTGTGARTNYVQVKEPKLAAVWNAYKDSVYKFYADTMANASFRPYKTFGTPVTLSSVRGALNSYDDILMDIKYPKSIRSINRVVYTNPAGKRFYAKGEYMNSDDCFMRRMDSTIIYTNPVTKADRTPDGSMAFDDGGFTGSEVALFKAWYFADPNIPDAWKYGPNNTGIFRYKATNRVIKK